MLFPILVLDVTQAEREVLSLTVTTDESHPAVNTQQRQGTRAALQCEPEKVDHRLGVSMGDSVGLAVNTTIAWSTWDFTAR